MFFNQYPYINQNDLNLDWIIKHFKEFIAELASLNEWKATHEVEYQQLVDFENSLINGDFPPKMIESLKEWTVKNTESIIAAAIKMVFFGITNDGYFVAYIPESWDDITFTTTGYDTPLMGLDYGHLVLSY